MKNDGHTSIDTSMIDKISILAQLSLTEEEKILAGEDMARMLDFFALLAAWEEKEQDPVESTDKKTKITGNILRRDEVTNEEAGEELVANAPLQKDGMFVVPLSISAGYEEESGDGQD